jgi:4-amino-4-deoxy-L-arabinose transferase-like glycosyltransferase
MQAADDLLHVGNAPTRRPVPWGAVVVAVALFTGLVMVLVLFGRQSLVDGNVDPYYFGDMGASVADGNGFDGFGSLIKRRAPLYPLMIGGVYTIVGEHERAVMLVHVLFFATTCLLAYDIGRRVFNQRTGVLAALACAMHPMLLRYLPSLHLETQLTLLMTLVLWLMVRFYEKPTVRNGVLVGVAAGLGTLTKAVVIAYPVLFALGVVLACRAARKRGQTIRTPWVPLVVIGVAMGLTIVPWTIRNYRATGHFVLVSSGTSDAFLRGFIFSRTEFITLERPPYTDAENESNAYFRSLAAAEGTEWERDDYETDQILNAEAKRRLTSEPFGVVRKTVVGLFTFWYQLTSLKNSLLAIVLAVPAWLLAAIGWRRARQEARPAWLLFLPILYLNISLALLLALGRYSVPILPALMVMAAYGLDSVLTRRGTAGRA